MKKEKRPQDWTLEERLNMIISCDALHDQALSEYCREQGIYPHHLAQWKLDFTNGRQSGKPVPRNEVKTLKHENKVLKKALNRKDKALAETAALLVLQKKVHEIWGNDEDSSL
jgi:transposase